MSVTIELLTRQVLEQTQLAAQAVEYEFWRATPLTALACYHARSGQEEQAFEIAATILDDACRARALLKMLPHLTQPRQQQALDQAWASAEAVSDRGVRSHALADVAEHFPEPQKSRCFEQAFLDAQAMKEEASRVSSLEKILYHLSAETLQQALQSAQAMRKKSPRARILAEIALSLPDAQKREVLEQAFASICTTQEPPPTARIIVETVGSDTVVLKKILSALVELGRTERAFEMLEASPDSVCRASVLATVALHLAEPLRQQTLEQALTAAHAIADVSERIRVLAEIAACSQEPFKLQVAAQALLAVPSIESAFSQYLSLWKILPHLSTTLCQQALTMAQSIQDSLARALILAQIALYVPEPQQQPILEQALAAARSVASDHWRADALKRVVASLSKIGGIEQALRITQTIDDKTARALALANVVDSLVHDEAQTVCLFITP